MNDKVKEFIVKRFKKYQISYIYDESDKQVGYIIMNDNNGIMVCPKKYYNKKEYEWFDNQVLEWFLSFKGKDETFEVLNYFLKGSE